MRTKWYWMEQSRLPSWNDPEGKPVGRDAISQGLSVGCLQRIANATELMAKNHADLVAERNNAIQRYVETVNCIAQRDHVIAGLRGQITKMKKRNSK